MTLIIEPHQPVPLKIDLDGTWRVGDTRVLLDLVIHAFNAGRTLEEIVQSYDTLHLNEVYAVFAYYLKGDLAEADLGKLARLGIGATPATVEGWLKEARGMARVASRPLQLADILGQMLPREDRTPECVLTIALH